MDDKERQEIREHTRTVFALVNCFFKDREKTVKWMNTENHLLGDVTPIDMLAMSKGYKLIKFVKNMIEENERS